MRIGIDIGGTKAAIVLMDNQEQLVARCKVPTGADRPCRQVIAEIVGAMQEMLAQQQVDLADVTFIGAGVPGTVDQTAQIVVHAPNLHWHNEPVGEYFIQACGKRVLLAQDTRAAAWGEYRARKDKCCVASVTLGTGIGCGIVLNGRIWHGALGTAGEIGHIPVSPGGRRCACGRSGCMEAYASGTGITCSAREQGVCDSSEELFALAGHGNMQALEILRDAVDQVAVSIVAMINVLSPDVVLFSGGLAAQQELFIHPLMERIRQWAYPQAAEGLELAVSAMGGDAPAIGAAFIDEGM